MVLIHLKRLIRVGTSVYPCLATLRPSTHSLMIARTSALKLFSSFKSCWKTSRVSFAIKLNRVRRSSYHVRTRNLLRPCSY